MKLLLTDLDLLDKVSQYIKIEITNINDNVKQIIFKFINNKEE